MYQTASQGIFNYMETGKFINVQHRIVMDPTTTYGSADHLIVLLPAVIIFFILNVVPPLLLMLYPVKAFKLCLSKCRLDFIAVDIFSDKLQGCYRNGLDKRMRHEKLFWSLLSFKDSDLLECFLKRY